ncbi:MAG: hypothetical protein AAGF25_00515 [Pseudomonadota bacterium]
MATESSNQSEKSSIWRFTDLFKRGATDAEKKDAAVDLVADLKAVYPKEALVIIDFLGNVLRRRQPIVEYLNRYPELNDHGFFMVICKMYRDTYHGIGHTNDRVTNLIAMFSTSDVSRATAARTLQKATKAKVLVARRDEKDRRKQRYYLHEDMIALCSNAFGGMIDDVIEGHRKVGD